MGYEVTVFEALPAAGGMMRVGIPPIGYPGMSCRKRLMISSRWEWNSS